MKFPFQWRRLAAILPLALALLAGPAVSMAAQTQAANAVTVVSLTAAAGDENIENPPRNVRSDLLLANDGNLYFASYSGGLGAGAIGKLTPDGQLSTLYSLASNGSEGVTLYGSLIQGSDGALYGTSYFGGAEGGGTLFRVTLDGEFTVLKAFGGGRVNGVYSPLFAYTGVTEGPDGMLYGTTFRGGRDDAGVIYRIGLDGSNFSVLYHFSDGDGENPEGALAVGPDGMLYGTTMMGGSSNRGVIYRISTEGAYEVLYSFPSLTRFNSQGLATNATGANPRAGLTLGPDGAFYGTTYQGGEFGHGTFYRVTLAGEVTVMHAFRGPSFDGSSPVSPVSIDADGNFYGTTQAGGNLHRGAVWRLSADGTQYDLLHSFSGLTGDGQQPWAGVTHAHGRIYAVSYSDTVGDAGTIIRLDTGTNGVLPVTLTISQTEIERGDSVTLDWSAPADATCTKLGGITGWSGEATATGTLTISPPAGGYTFGLSCTDADDGDESTPRTVRIAYVGLFVRAPLLQPVDGGGGAGALSLWWLLALAALLTLRITKEKRSPCP